MMPHLRNRVRLLLPVLLLFALYWPGLTTWFYQDDFGWLNLRHDVQSAGDLASALFAPKAHGNMRPLGENAYWLGLSAIFGVEPLPFHLWTFATQAGSLLLLGAIVERLVAWEWAGLCAQVLWLVNIGLAPAMAWSSIYNQVLSGFFFLLAFYLLLRAIESGRRGFEAAHWAAFVLGLGALEINVVYPALAVMYAWIWARAWVPRILPMFAVSGAVAATHFYFAPVAQAGVYAPRVDAAIARTLFTYWRWAVGPMPLAAALVLLACAAVLIVWGVRRGDYAPLLGAAWFVFPLMPYLPLPDHKMDYYLAVPALGIAMLGTSALASSRRLGAPLRAGVYLAIALYAAGSAQSSWAAVRWQHARAEKVEDLVLGVEEVRRASPGKIVLLEGVDTDLFWSGVADLPFRAMGIASVYLAPGSESRIQAAPVLLSKYVLPETIALRAAVAGGAAVYRFDGQALHEVPGRAAQWKDDEVRFVNLGDPVFAEYTGEGWDAAANASRRMRSRATLRIGGPRTVSESLYLGVFETRDVRPLVRVDGVECGTAVARRDNDLTEFRVTLPSQVAGRKLMDVAIESPRPLLFGYAEVR